MCTGMRRPHSNSVEIALNFNEYGAYMRTRYTWNDWIKIKLIIIYEVIPKKIVWKIKTQLICTTCARHVKNAKKQMYEFGT